MSAIRKGFAGLLLALGLGAAHADDALLKPFILGSKGPGEVAAKADAAKNALAAQGFTLAGSYTPIPLKNSLKCGWWMVKY